MKTKSKKILLEQLKKVPIVEVACEKTGISRQTFYRWKNQSKSFSSEIESAMKEGIDFVNDMSETQLLNLIKDGEFKAIAFWLRYKNSNYRDKIEVTHKTEEAQLTKDQQKIISKTLHVLNKNYEK